MIFNFYLLFCNYHTSWVYQEVHKFIKKAICHSETLCNHIRSRSFVYKLVEVHEKYLSWKKKLITTPISVNYWWHYTLLGTNNYFNCSFHSPWCVFILRQLSQRLSENSSGVNMCKKLFPKDFLEVILSFTQPQGQGTVIGSLIWMEIQAELNRCPPSSVHLLRKMDRPGLFNLP